MFKRLSLLFHAMVHGFEYFWENLSGAYLIKASGPAVTVFGSSRTKEDSVAYRQAIQLGRMLAQAHYTVITGGGPGMMRAAHEGAYKAGGCCVSATIALERNEPPHPFVHIIKRFNHFSARKRMLMRYSSAFVVMPGGLGTLDELFETMMLMQTGFMPQAPVILVGKAFWEAFWSQIRSTLTEYGMVEADSFAHIVITDDLDMVVSLIQAHKHSAQHERV